MILFLFFALIIEDTILKYRTDRIITNIRQEKHYNIMIIEADVFQ